LVNGMMNAHLHGLLEDGKKQAIRSGKNVLVSSVSEADITDVPSFFSFQAERFGGSRFFWSEPGRDISFAGLGCALVIETDDPDRRFQMVESTWKEMAGTCLVDRDIPDYTGPLLFGGFSFDPDKPKSALWRHFPHARFVVPQYMLTFFHGKAWLTVNKLISPSGDQEDGGEEPDWRGIKADLTDQRLMAGKMKGKKIYKEEIAPADWMNSVVQAAASIRKGQLEKVVLARQMRLFAEEPFYAEDILMRLLREQDNTYVFAIANGPDCFIGATPERLIKGHGTRFQTLSLAGSIARGKTSREDSELGDMLSHDGKNLHEHALAVEMIKNVMMQLCEKVHVPESPVLFKLKDIQHLSTPISGEAREGVSLLRAVEALHPTPALGGMPRAKAIETIRELERMDRGWYAAPIGWIDWKMNGEFAVAIRSALVQGKEASLFAGCGVMGDSDPVSEYHETALKFRPMLSALQALEAEA